MHIESHSVPTPFGPIRAPVGNVIRPERFVRPIPRDHLRLVEETPPDLCELLRQSERAREQISTPRGLLLALFISVIVYVLIAGALGATP